MRSVLTHGILALGGYFAKYGGQIAKLMDMDPYDYVQKLPIHGSTPEERDEFIHLGVSTPGEIVERFAESFDRWWADMGSPALTPETRGSLARGVEAEAAGRDFDQLAGERDRKLVAILQSLRHSERTD